MNLLIATSPVWGILLLVLLIGAVRCTLRYRLLKKEPWRNSIAKGLMSPNQWCRWFGCVNYSKGYYRGMPQATCYDCGTRCYGAMDGVPDYGEGRNDAFSIALGIPLAKLIDWSKKA